MTVPTRTQLTKEEIEMVWSKKWPVKKGWYWFYGWTAKPGRLIKQLPRMTLVQVRHARKKTPIYITEGRFLFRAEGAAGLWASAELPEPPRLDTDEFQKELFGE